MCTGNLHMVYGQNKWGMCKSEAGERTAWGLGRAVRLQHRGVGEVELDNEGAEDDVAEKDAHEGRGRCLHARSVVAPCSPPPPPSPSLCICRHSIPAA